MTRSNREPWLQSNHEDVPALPRALMHALEHADVDLEQWCGDFDEEQLNAHPASLPSVAFHIRHIARGVDRLLSYAEGDPLSAEQLRKLEAESQESSNQAELFAELHDSFSAACERVTKLAHGNMEEVRTVGREQLPSTLGGILVHIAEHTQRHVGQAITTAKVLKALPAKSA